MYTVHIRIRRQLEQQNAAPNGSDIVPGLQLLPNPIVFSLPYFILFFPLFCCCWFHRSEEHLPSACLATFAVFAPTSHIFLYRFSVLGLLCFAFLLLLACYENFNFNTGACVCWKNKYQSYAPTPAVLAAQSTFYYLLYTLFLIFHAIFIGN